MLIAATDLCADILTLLCFLHANDVAPRPKRFLPPKVLVRLAPLMCVPDITPPTPLSGELSTQRLRFVHYLAEAAGLIAPTGSFLKPTPAALLWLTLPGIERTRQIFRRGFAPQSREDQRLWKTYRLPGWQSLNPTNTVRRVLSRISVVQTDEPLTVAMLFPPIAAPDTEEVIVSPPDVARELLDYLAWFGVIQWLDGSTVYVTDLGQVLRSGRRGVH